MATTDARPGFKLPWSADRTEPDAPDVAPVAAEPEAAPEAAPAPPSETTFDTTSDRTPEAVSVEDAPEAVAPEHEPVLETAPQHAAALDGAAEPGAQPTPVAAPASPQDPWRLAAQPFAPAEPARRKPNKLMADLTRAMQTAAESARAETLERLQSDAKAFIETVHARSGTEADALRRTADDDIAGIREWSKAEIARIREETDQQVADRKVGLEQEIEAHAARIEGQIERVQRHVAWFESEMADFFERLLAEDDPTRLAAMAENLPEPPSFEDEPPKLTDTAPLPDVAAPVAVALETTEADPEASFAAIQAAAEAAAVAEAAVVEAAEATTTEAAEAITTDVAKTPGAEEATTAEAVEATTTQVAEGPGAAEAREAAPTVQPTFAPVSVAGPDPRLAVLGLTPQAAAEAEAEAELDGAGDVEEIESISDEALSARLAGLVPADGGAPASDLRSTRVIVTGLVSVASIASFKRHLGRFEGASSVGVSSGPEGEFIFTVVHALELDVAAVIPGLPGFSARVTDTTDDTVTVAARDPETGS